VNSNTVNKLGNAKKQIRVEKEGRAPPMVKLGIVLQNVEKKRGARLPTSERILIGKKPDYKWVTGTTGN